MWVMYANNEDFGLGEGTTINAFSESETKLKKWCWDDAIKQGCKEENLRWHWNEEFDVWVLQEIYISTADKSEDDNWDTWVVVEYLKYYELDVPVNVDAL